MAYIDGLQRLLYMQSQKREYYGIIQSDTKIISNFAIIIAQERISRSRYVVNYHFKLLKSLKDRTYINTNLSRN